MPRCWDITIATVVEIRRGMQPTCRVAAARKTLLRPAVQDSSTASRRINPHRGILRLDESNLKTPRSPHPKFISSLSKRSYLKLKSRLVLPAVLGVLLAPLWNAAAQSPAQTS